jgi:P4 family phage/plasmid primase-like protien
MAQVANDQPPHPAIAFITALFGSNTEQPIFLQTLANDPGDLDEANNKKRLLTRDVAPLVKFIGSHDRNRRGMFFCVATVAKGSSTRNKETVRETIALHADIDFKGVVEDEAAIRAQVAKLRCQPTVIVRSGGGLHLYWCFKESLDTQEYLALIEGALRRLADIVAGDLAVCEVARLMRLPGTHNSKYGDMREVVCERLDGPRYELDELEEWMSEQQPVLTRKPPEPRPGVKAEPDDNPYLKHAREWGYKPRLDVEARLASMSEGNVHITLRDVAASLIHAGEPFEAVVCLLMEAARKVGGPDWNWRVEEKKIRGLCDSAERKFPPKDALVSHETDDKDNIVDLGEARAKAKPKPKPRGPSALLAPFIVADGVIETLRRHGADILLSEGDIWLYGDGFWRIMTPADQQWLLTEIQTGFEALGEPAKTSALHSSWKRLNEHPRLFKAVVPWAGGDLIVCTNGVRRIETGHFEGHRPENYARRCIGAAFDPAAACPRFEALLYDMLKRADLIDLVQEWLGAALSIGSLSREERRALILVGPSRTGKTELARIFALLLGGPIATPSVASISEDGDRFALSSLYQAAAWIRDDAINEGDKLNPQRFKTIVTGEPIDVELKRKDIVRNHRFELPVCLTCNSLPRAIDGSDAIFNRSLILRMENVIDEEVAAKARTENEARPGQSIGVAIFEAEAPGILNWALVGLGRLRKRGFYDIPESVKDAISRFKDDNNPIGEWVREAVIADRYSMVERRDLVRSFNGWQFEQEGEKAVGRGGRWLLPKLRNQVPGIGDYKSGDGSKRYVTGVKLSELGLTMWKTYGDANPHGGAGGCATVVTDVNKGNKGDFSHAPDAALDIPF